ncbi:MAG: TonB-dependent siderophore receptor [Acidobacteriota bacterium]
MRAKSVRKSAGISQFVTAVLFASALFAPAAWAQAPRTFTGTVLAADHNPIADAKVSIAQENAAVYSGVSDTRGEFSASLKQGRYKVVITADGFMDVTETLDLGESTSTHQFLLQITPQKYAITVSDRAPYIVPSISTATKTATPLLDIPQSITIVTKELIRDQMMMSVGDVVRYIPGMTAIQGENNRDQLVIRGNSTSGDFYVNGVRDDVQYYRDLYNIERVEAIKGPNAMEFGRGGGGGIINRATKEAEFMPLREITIQGGSFGTKRFAADFDQPFGDKVALRMNGVYENSGTFRDYVGLRRNGFSPTLTLLPGKSTRITLSYENFHDNRTADRGITSFLGLPADVPVTRFYGDPHNAYVSAVVNNGAIGLEHRMGRLTLHNRTQFANYDRIYQNYVPGVVNTAKTLVAVTAYNNATQRMNFFNQTDLSYELHTGRIKHVLLSGIELGRQTTNNYRNTGFFNNTATSLSVDYNNPLITASTVFRQSATDADNHLLTRVGAAFVQDQISISRYVQVTAGLRVDQFDLRYHNNRNGDNLRRIDNLISPRAGITFKPIAHASIYGNYAVSYLPSSGDQFSSLTTITQQVKPEKFTNYEAGVKLDLNHSFSLTTAVYRLDRTNTRSTDPNDPTRIIQTGSTRSKGFEAGVNGNIMRKWQVAGGYAYQDVYISSATTASVAGRKVGQTPHNTFSLWNNFQLTHRLGTGLGILNRAAMFAAVDNTVTLPGYTRADLAGFYSITEKIRLQVNVENLFNKKYYINADSNTNISPGSTRAVRAGITARF